MSTPEPDSPACVPESEGAAFDPPTSSDTPVEFPDFDELRSADRRTLFRDAALAAERATGREESSDEETQRSLLYRYATIVVGFVVLLGGVAMIVLPGPGVVGILAGLGILSRELPWAERMTEYVKKRAKIDELKEQPKWVQAAMWTVTAAAVLGSLAYFLFVR